MKIITVIEVIASSETGFDDAAQNAIIEASKSIQNIQSIYIKEMKAKVENNQITSYEIIGKISFVVDK
jgi:flavin-binding protein dodecin